jgi:hypothetical protein
MAANQYRQVSNSESSVAAQITRLSGVGRIEVVDSETISSDLTIPESIELVPNGGVLTIAENATLTIEGKVSGQPGGLITFEDGFDTSGPDASNYPTLKIYGPTVPGARIVKQLRTSYVNRPIVEIHNHPVCPTVFGLKTYSYDGLNDEDESNTDCFNDCAIAASSYGGDTRSGAEIRIPNGFMAFDKPVTTLDWYWPKIGSSEGADRDHKIIGGGKRKSIMMIASNAFDYVGAWSNGQSYSKGDIVRASDDKEYICLIAGTASGDDSDLAGTNADTVGSDGLYWQEFKAWFDFDDISNGVIRDVGFDGAKIRQTSGTWPTYQYTDVLGDVSEIAHPLVKFSSYLFSLDTVDVRNSKGTGVLFFSSQSYSIRQLSSTRHDSWGVVIAGSTGMNIMDLDSENHAADGGVLIHQLDGGQRDRILGVTFSGTLYLEGTNPGIRVEGVTGVKQVGNMLHTPASGVGKCVELGPGAKNCEFDIRAVETNAICEAGSFNNKITYNPNGSYGVPEDNGDNVLVPVGGYELYRWEPLLGVTGDELLAHTNPVLVSPSTSATILNQEGHSELLHPAASYDGSSLKFKRLAPTTSTWSRITAVLIGKEVATRYFYVHSMLTKPATVEVRFRNNDGNLYYNPVTQEFDSSVGIGIAIPHIPGVPRFSKVAFPYPDGDPNPNMQIEFGMYNTVTGAVLDIYYISISNEANKRLEYYRSNNEYGFGDKPQFAFASLPAASLFDDGVQVYVTDRGRYATSDGTDWLDYDGTTMS